MLCSLFRSNLGLGYWEIKKDNSEEVKYYFVYEHCGKEI